MTCSIEREDGADARIRDCRDVSRPRFQPSRLHYVYQPHSLTWSTNGSSHSVLQTHNALEESHTLLRPRLPVGSTESEQRND